MVNTGNATSAYFQTLLNDLQLEFYWILFPDHQITPFTLTLPDVRLLSNVVRGLRWMAPGFTNAKKGLPQSWCNISAGRSGFAYAAAFKLKGRFGVELYIDTGDKEKNEQYFDRLYEQKDDIEQELNMALSWERLDNARACRIASVRDGSIEAGEEEAE